LTGIHDGARSAGARGDLIAQLDPLAKSRWRAVVGVGNSSTGWHDEVLAPHEP
jgi:hypothetical protein